MPRRVFCVCHGVLGWGVLCWLVIYNIVYCVASITCSCFVCSYESGCVSVYLTTLSVFAGCRYINVCLRGRVFVLCCVFASCGVCVFAVL